ncbi:MULTISPECIES: GLPGLI family protein [Tenacibaculum]|uniref:GLPGLI family protein n=1 Tax=Tenacibaculum TaxID=104267 RepID=UPI001F0B2963|nr:MULTISPECIES: GLPGLI family protein [Tenacibaculum]MCH3881567.1 GLPGLI family protein [Tenacibaculum aquimarinum]MDO6598838.1 GLPGLI family protein [Tenacibaculum sp. 1_MG-2023]
MKKTLLILCLITKMVYSQTGIVIYKAESLKNYVKDNLKIKAISEEIDIMTFTLSYSKKSSYFKKENNLPKDQRYSKLARILIRSDSDWFQYSDGLKSIVNREVKDKVYQVQYKKMINWVLKEDAKIIDGFTCYKAVRTELNKRTNKYVETIAWYTPDIPVPYGPLGNGGLPGLILQLIRPNLVSLTTKKITLNPKRIKKTPKLINGELITSDELVKLMRDARKVTPD